MDSDVKDVGGVFLPAEEEHLEEWMTVGKRAEWRDGKLTYQIHKLDAAMKYVNERKVAIDVGAHVGLWSMWLIKYFSQVMSFEPSPRLGDIFHMNVEGSNHVLFRCALGMEHGYISLTNNPGESTGNTHVGQYSEAKFPGSIEIRPLDSFEFKDVDFIKIDTEGFEYPVVAGATKTILSNKPIVVVEEKGYDRRYFNREPKAAVRYLESLGMKTYEVLSGDHIMGW